MTRIPLLPMAAVLLSACLGQVAPAAQDAAVATSGAISVDAFDPANWAGRAPPEQAALLKPIGLELQAAMNAHDGPRIAAAVAKLRTGLGRYAGVPEERPVYGTPKDMSPPELAKVTAAFRETYAPFLTRSPWRDPAQSGEHPTVRLRVDLRIAEAFLRYAASGAPDGDRFGAEAKTAFAYMLRVQAPSGVFGYPYNTATPSAVASEANRMVEAARAQGRDLTWRGWIVDDNQTGNLNFDNAVTGAGLLYAFQLYGDPAYLAAARRAADWAIGRRLVTNFNYNALNAYFLARFYRVTGERKYLDAAKVIFRDAVLPGQMENGRWVDQHNAKIQYHSIIMRHGIELYLALRQANDPYADDVRRHVELGLDNVAAQINRFGASDADEALATEALILGLQVFGERPAWRSAVNVDVNYIVGPLRPQMAARNRPIAEPIALYIQSRLRPGGFEAGLATGR